jgi:hypothetical protein
MGPFPGFVCLSGYQLGPPRNMLAHSAQRSGSGQRPGPHRHAGFPGIGQDMVTVVMPGERGSPRVADDAVQQLKSALHGAPQHCGLVEGGLQGEPDLEDAAGDAGQRVLELMPLHTLLRAASRATRNGHREVAHQARAFRWH